MGAVRADAPPAREADPALTSDFPAPTACPAPAAAPTGPSSMEVAACWATRPDCAPTLRAPRVIGPAATAECITAAASMPVQCTNRHVSHGANTAIESSRRPTSRSDKPAMPDGVVLAAGAAPGPDRKSVV